MGNKRTYVREQALRLTLGTETGNNISYCVRRRCVLPRRLRLGANRKFLCKKKRYLRPGRQGLGVPIRNRNTVPTHCFFFFFASFTFQINHLLVSYELLRVRLGSSHVSHQNQPIPAPGGQGMRIPRHRAHSALDSKQSMERGGKYTNSIGTLV